VTRASPSPLTSPSAPSHRKLSHGNETDYALLPAFGTTGRGNRGPNLREKQVPPWGGIERGFRGLRGLGGGHREERRSMQLGAMPAGDYARLHREHSRVALAIFDLTFDPPKANPHLIPA
jgi:hypothetical protein